MQLCISIIHLQKPKKMASFRPVHLMWLLVLMIILQSAIIYLSSPNHEQVHVRPPVHHHRAAKTRSVDLPRIAILTMSHHHNIKAYCSHWGYDHIDATKSVQIALASLRRYGGDPSFIRSFALLRFLPQYDYIFWHDSNSIFLNFSKSLDDHIDSHFDIILPTSPCQKDGVDPEFSINTNHFIVKNSKESMNTLKSVWMMWNHTKCKYPEHDYDEIHLCQVVNNRSVYHRGMFSHILFPILLFSYSFLLRFGFI